MGHRWHKFCLLIWKNWLLQKRHKVQTIVEVMAPVMFAGIIVLIRAMVVPEARGQMQHKKINASNFYAGLYTHNPQVYDVVPLYKSNFIIAYAPQTPQLTSVMNQSLQYLLSSNRVIPFESALKHLNGFSETSQMMEYLTDPSNTETVVCGVEFGKSFIGSDWPEDMEMTMHFAADLTTVLEPRSAKNNWKTGFMYPSSQVPGPRNPLSWTGGPPGYFDEGFAPLVHAICREITMAISGKGFPLVTVQRLPHPKYVSDSMISIMKSYLALILVIAFNYNCINTVKSVAMEKERQLKEVMKIMGLDNWLHWTAWFIKTLSYNMLSILLMCFVFKVEWYSEGEGISDHSVFTFTPWHVILVFMVLYMITSVCFCLMLSVFFSKANTAATVAGMIWFMSFSPFMVMKNDKLILPLNLRLVACLSSNAAMGFGFKIILENEATGAGLHWTNMWTPTTVEDPMVLAHIMLMLTFDAILYMLIALYVEQVFPGTYGVPQHFWFPLSIYFWRSMCGCPKIYKDTEEEVEKNEALEPDPEGLALGINIIRLTKKYGKKVVVDKLTFKIFQDQITVVLGHNGAGKTTAMSMLTGMFPPTSGTAVVVGHDIVTDIKGVRASIGICPQHDVLFAELTVAEHIYFYAKIKGLSGKALSEEVDKYVSLLALDAKRNVRSSALSGGMQRRLSVGTALCGGSTVILLDEPSSGMDPAARRHLWDLLHAEKKGRTIILSTHFMDEAEVLGDRVAIMSAGCLAAVGSPFFLKNQFGSGYRLTAATKGLPSAPITQLIQGYIPKAQLHSEVGSEICYTLPQNEVNNFQPMLADLESKQKSLGLASFGLSAATLEDVFMKVGADAVETTDAKGKMTFQESGTDESESEPEKEPPDNAEAGKETYKCHKGCRLYCGQWWAMLYKKILVTFSTLLFSVMQIVVPVMILLIAVAMSKLWITNVDLPSLELSMSKMYTDTVTLVHSDSKDKDTETRIDKYKDYFAEAKISTMKVVDTGSKTVEDYYLEEAKTNLPLMRTRNLVGATFENNESVTAWFSNFGLHDLPVSLVLIHNAILKSESPKKSYKVINQPLPYRLENQLELTSGSGEIDNAGFQVAFHIGFAMSFVAAFYVMFCIKENMCRSKLLQLASGASPFIMWGAAFVWDLLCYMLVVLAMTITLFLSDLVGFATPGEIGRVVIILIVYGYAVLPMHYVASGFFSNGSTGFSVMCLFNVLGGVATFVIVEILSNPGLNLTEYGTAFHWAVLIIPSYALCGAIKNFYEASLLLDSCLASCKRYKLSDCDQNVVCKLNPVYKKCCLSDYPFFEWEKPGVGQNATFMIIVGSVSFIILLIREYGIANECLRKMRCGKSPAPPEDDEDEDDDVAVERKLVNDLSKDDYKNFSLVLKDMSKSYTNFQAVKKLCLAIKSGECFGLLGINGAGKTTTFKMLTGDHKITSGEAWVKGFSVKNDMKTAYRYIGYCPQFDALLDEMTGRQTLQMFSKLRGIPKVNQKKFVWDLSKNLGYVKHLDKKVREYSGGNKRKLSTSVALLGDPEVVYLDEPTTSMDPMAKRQVWKALAGRKTGSVVLTSHSMEECEALCTRLAIMVNGRFRCIGSTQHLKNKFSKGYTLIVKVRRRKSRLEIDSDKPNLDKVGWNLGNLTEDWLTKTTAGKELPPIEGRKRRSTMFNKEPLHLFILRTFPGATLQESYQGKMTYYLPDKKMTWSNIFGIMEKAKKELDIEDYSIGQTSLEQVFLQFTKEQKGDDD